MKGVGLPCVSPLVNSRSAARHLEGVSWILFSGWGILEYTFAQVVPNFLLLFGQHHVLHFSDSSMFLLATSNLPICDARSRNRSTFRIPVLHQPHICTRLLSVFSSTFWNFTFLFQACSVLYIVFFIIDSRFPWLPAVTLLVRSRCLDDICLNRESIENRTLIADGLIRHWRRVFLVSWLPRSIYYLVLLPKTMFGCAKSSFLVCRVRGPSLVLALRAGLFRRHSQDR